MRLVLKMENLDCAHCAQKMEDKIAKLQGVESVSISFMAQKMILQYSDGADKEALLAQVRAAVCSVDKHCTVK
ncbi:MAG: heavy-metal-associated domain-containing protein [Clostridia bacterium]|nr:heavy-metal-associated domain-containing protein [Clostridia bacterium]